VNDVLNSSIVSYCEGKSSACQVNNGDCSNLCIPLITGFTCACPDFWRLAADNKTCISGIFYCYYKNYHLNWLIPIGYKDSRSR